MYLFYRWWVEPPKGTWFNKLIAWLHGCMVLMRDRKLGSINFDLIKTEPQLWSLCCQVSTKWVRQGNLPRFEHFKTQDLWSTINLILIEIRLNDFLQIIVWKKITFCLWIYFTLWLPVEIIIYQTLKILCRF